MRYSCSNNLKYNNEDVDVWCHFLHPATWVHREIIIMCACAHSAWRTYYAHMQATLLRLYGLTILKMLWCAKVFVTCYHLSTRRCVCKRLLSFISDVQLWHYLPRHCNRHFEGHSAQNGIAPFLLLSLRRQVQSTFTLNNGR